MSLRQKFERVRNYWNEKSGSWLAIDFEEWERDSTVLTEFGWSCLEFKNGEEHQTDGHLIVKEHLMYTNTVYVQGNRDVSHLPPGCRMLVIDAPSRTTISGTAR